MIGANKFPFELENDIHQFFFKKYKISKNGINQCQSIFDFVIFPFAV